MNADKNSENKIGSYSDTSKIQKLTNKQGLLYEFHKEECDRRH